MPNDRQSRLNEVARIAVALEDETQLPAKLLLAQWAVESSWGEKPVGKANYFGIKCASRHSRCCSVPTQEVINGKRVTLVLKFADYVSLEESCRDYAWLITHGAPYAAAWAEYLKTKNFPAFAHSILSTYATAQYGSLAIQITSQPNIMTAIENARANRIVPAQTT